ncbi:MAG TPA: TolC family protein [Bacteroidales bacterium]|nr:TolC family protein [Bacteroidales bacterium]
MKSHLVIGLLFWLTQLSAQPVLQDYIKTGLQNNLALQQKQNNYEMSLQQLKQARGLFYPSVSVNARYTVSEGGRVIEFPVGDLLNPVYMTLNQLTSSNQFPVLENQEIAFLRPTEHETKLRLVQPLFNTDIYYNARIKREQTVTEQINIEQYKRELVAEIKKAYYNLCMSQNVLTMLNSTRSLLLENIRINKSLFENNKVTRDVLLRSETELHKFDQQLNNAHKNAELAGAYFNFLLNRPLKDSITVEDPGEWVAPSGMVSDFIDMAGKNREEIKNLEQYRKISDMAVNMNRAARLPDILVVADYGFQGEKYRFNKNQDYLQASAVLTWDLFAGLQNKSKIKQSLIASDQVDKQLEEVRSRISLQVISAFEDMRTSETGFEAAKEQLATASEGFRIVNKKYSEGQASLIEYMDARNTLTQAEENLIISKYTCLSKKADFDNIIAVDIPENNN